MSYESRVKELEELLKDHKPGRPEPAELDFTFFVLHGEQARLKGTQWHARRRELYGIHVTLETYDEFGKKVIICRRPRCKHCERKYSEHQPAGGACLFGSTTYKEPPL